jgi:hypothetical protein
MNDQDGPGDPTALAEVGAVLLSALTDDERAQLSLQATYRAQEHLDIRYYRDFTSEQRAAGHARWTAIADALKPGGDRG